MTDSALPDPRAGTHPASDQTLIVREDFATFYARHVRSLVGLAYVLSGSHSGAEDLAQEALLVAYRNWSRIDSYDNPGAWVRRVAANRACSASRRRVAEAKALLRLHADRVVVPQLSDESEELWAAVRSLPRRQAQVIALRYWDNLSIRETAEVLELSEATVKSHLQRARQTLTDTYRPSSSRRD